MISELQLARIFVI